MSVPRFNADASIYRPTINYASALITDIAAHQPLPLAAQPVRLEVHHIECSVQASIRRVRRDTTFSV